MKKVGLMTWYKYFNYGTAMQVTSLYKVISNFGYECNLINYKPKGSNLYKKGYRELKTKILRKFKKRSAYNNENRSNLFKYFLEHNVT